VRRWLAIGAGVVALGAIVIGIGWALSLWTLFGDKEPGVRSCTGGFRVADWRRDRKATGRAIAKCNWLDGRRIDAVVRDLGTPDLAPYHHFYSWDVGYSKNGIGPTDWFLVLTERGGVVTQSTAEERPT
jgi:hypothetical protein